MTTADIAERLEYLRGEIHAQRISYGGLFELQGLAEHIEPGDVELLEWAGVPEFEPESDSIAVTVNARGKSESDILDALREAIRRIEDGCTSGFDSNDDSSFDFTVEHDA